MGEGVYEHVEVSKKGRHRKKLLYNSILQLMEFYFSDSNLAKDRFLTQLINKNPSIDLEIFLKFNKIRKLNCTVDDIRKAISKSKLIELSEDGKTVKRILPIKFNQNVDNCTIYVENIKADADHDWVSHIFSEFGNVVYVSIPKYKHNKTNKGFAFVEFENEISAKNALSYFESIGCKMPSETSPENLKSIQTFTENEENINKSEKVEDSEMSENIQDNNETVLENSDMDQETVKRKLTEVETPNKKIKLDNVEDEHHKDVQIQNIEVDDNESKKKKKHKKDKKKNMIKELGLQVLSKPEWKKMRNRYLDLQKKKMKEFKQYLNRQKFSQKSYDKSKKTYTDTNQIKEESKEEVSPKLEFLPGVIVKVVLPEAVTDAKKIKNELKAISSDIKYVDIPLPSGSEEVFLRFSNAKAAKDFCFKEFNGEKTVLHGDEEQSYWQKIQSDRDVKFSKNVRKQRGRDKLLKKAEKERAKHIKFDEGE